MSGESRANALLRAVERFIREENAHARRTRREEIAAGRPLTPAALVSTSRDEVDLAHADLVGGFTTADCRAARKLLNAARSEAKPIEVGGYRGSSGGRLPASPDGLTEGLSSAGLDAPLPCDVKVAHMTFRKGVKLRTLVDAATRWHEAAAWALKPDPEKLAEFKAWFERKAALEDDLEVGAGWSVLDLPAESGPGSPSEASASALATDEPPSPQETLPSGGRE